MYACTLKLAAASGIAVKSAGCHGTVIAREPNGQCTVNGDAASLTLDVRTTLHSVTSTVPARVKVGTSASGMSWLGRVENAKGKESPDGSFTENRHDEGLMLFPSNPLVNLLALWYSEYRFHLPESAL